MGVVYKVQACDHNIFSLRCLLQKQGFRSFVVMPLTCYGCAIITPFAEKLEKTQS